MFYNLGVKLERAGWFLVSAIIFRLSLELAYRGFVNPVFEYAGFVLDIDILKYIESWLIFLVLIVLFPRKLNKASDFLLAYLLFAYLTPLLVFYGLANEEREHLYIVIFSVLLILIFRHGRPLKLPILKEGVFIGYSIVVFGVILVTTWMLYNGGLGYFSLDLIGVYDSRRDIGQIIDRGVMAYLNVWAGTVFGPVLLAASLWRKKYAVAIVVIALHVVWFGISTHKAVLFYPLIILFLWAWFQNARALALIPVAMSIAVCMSFFAYIVFDDLLLSSLFVRRTFFVPSFLTFTYYEFFSTNPFVFWSESITSGFIDYPYKMNSADLIGSYLGTGAHANNSFLSTGYMHAGMLGMALYGVLGGCVFRIVDSISFRGLPVWVSIAAVIIPSNSLFLSADLPTTLLSHGLGIAILLMFLLRISHRSGHKLGDYAESK